MIKLLVSIAGADFSYAPGQEVSIDKKTDKRLIDSGQAVEVKAKPNPKAKSKGK